MKKQYLFNQCCKMKALLIVGAVLIATAVACSKKDRENPDPEEEQAEQQQPSNLDVDLSNVETVRFSWIAESQPVTGDLTLEISEREDFSQSESFATNGIVTSLSVGMESLNNLLGNGRGVSGAKSIYWRVKDSDGTVIVRPQTRQITPSLYQYLLFSSTANDMTFTKNFLFAYAYDITTTGTSPTVDTEILSGDIPENHVILDFQYQSADPFVLRMLYIQDGEDVDDDNAIDIYLPASLGGQWAASKIKIDKLPGEWGKEKDKLKLRWGTTPNRNIKVRKIHLREQRTGEDQTFSGTPDFIQINTTANAFIRVSVLGRPTNRHGQFQLDGGVSNYFYTDWIVPDQASVQKSTLHFQYKSTHALTDFGVRLGRRPEVGWAAVYWPTGALGSEVVFKEGIPGFDATDEWKDYSVSLQDLINTISQHPLNTSPEPRRHWTAWPDVRAISGSDETIKLTMLSFRFGTAQTTGAVFQIRNMYFSE